MSAFKLIPFGAPIMQEFYKNLCAAIGLSFDDFQMKLIEDTGKSYDELKQYLTCGEEIFIDSDELAEYMECNINTYLTIHFDLQSKSVLGIIDDDFDCFFDGFNYFIKDFPKPIRFNIDNYLNCVI